MLPAQLYLIRLSAYSPELNAMEWVWTPLKRDVSEAVWKSLDAMEVAITGGCGDRLVNLCCEQAHGPASGGIFKLMMVLSLFLPPLACRWASVNSAFSNSFKCHVTRFIIISDHGS